MGLIVDSCVLLPPSLDVGDDGLPVAINNVDMAHDLLTAATHIGSKAPR